LGAIHLMGRVGTPGGGRKEEKGKNLCGGKRKGGCHNPLSPFPFVNANERGKEKKKEGRKKREKTDSKQFMNLEKGVNFSISITTPTGGKRKKKGSTLNYF